MLYYVTSKETSKTLVEWGVLLLSDCYHPYRNNLSHLRFPRTSQAQAHLPPALDSGTLHQLHTFAAK